MLCVQAYTNSRCGLLPFKRFIESLSEGKREVVKELGMGGLLELKIQHHRNMQIEELMRHFDLTTRKLVVHGRELHITEEDVQRILGLSCGSMGEGEHYDLMRELKEKSQLKKVKRRELIVGMSEIQDKEEWEVKFIMLAIHCVLRPISSLNCSSATLEFLDHIGGLGEVNWCRYVLDGLVAGVMDFHNQLKNVVDGKTNSLCLKGCTLLLEVRINFFVYVVG